MTPVCSDIFIAVGSNIDPQVNIPAALERLRQCVNVLASSTFYRTKALDRPLQEDYRNGIWRIATDLPPRALKFDVLRRIETECGRVRTDDAYAPRTIDLDIVLYGNCIVDEPGLCLPDPDIRTRPFVAVPLFELTPDVVLPDTGEPLRNCVAGLCGTGLEPDRELTQHLREGIVI